MIISDPSPPRDIIWWALHWLCVVHKSTNNQFWQILSGNGWIAFLLPNIDICHSTRSIIDTNNNTVMMSTRNVSDLHLFYLSLPPSHEILSPPLFVYYTYPAAPSVYGLHDDEWKTQVIVTTFTAFRGRSAVGGTGALQSSPEEPPATVSRCIFCTWLSLPLSVFHCHVHALLPYWQREGPTTDQMKSILMGIDNNWAATTRRWCRLSTGDNQASGQCLNKTISFIEINSSPPPPPSSSPWYIYWRPFTEIRISRYQSY